MIGFLIAGAATFADETSTSIGKYALKHKMEGIFTMAFLNAIWMTAYFAILILAAPKSFVFSSASLPTFAVRSVLEILQCYLTVCAIRSASRSTYGFLRTITIPLLLFVDMFLGYHVTSLQIVGMMVIIGALLLLFLNHGLEKKGIGFVIFSAINSVATISLYKYNIDHFNSVVGEQFATGVVLLVAMGIFSQFIYREKPFRSIGKKLILAQTASHGLSAVMGGFVYLFFPASVTIALTRAMAVLWSFLFGNHFFHEKHFVLKFLGCAGLAAGIFLLMR